MPTEIMLSGTFYGAQAAALRMLPRQSGVIVNIASVNGLIAQSGRASYASAKAGVIRLTEVLAAEWASSGLRVNAIAPAVFMTDLARASLADGSANLDAYDLLLRAQQLEYEFAEESLASALGCLKQALAIDPNCARHGAGRLLLCGRHYSGLVT